MISRRFDYAVALVFALCVSAVAIAQQGNLPLSGSPATTGQAAGDGQWVRVDAENGPYTASAAGGFWEFRDDSGADYEVVKVCTNDGAECMTLSSRYLDVQSSFFLRRGGESRLSYGSTVTYIDSRPLSFRPSGDTDVTTQSGGDFRIDPDGAGEIELAASVNFLDASAVTLADVDGATGGARFASVGTCDLLAGAVASCAHGLSDTIVLEDSSHLVPETNATSDLGSASSKMRRIYTQHIQDPDGQLTIGGTAAATGNVSAAGQLQAPQLALTVYTAAPTCNAGTLPYEYIFDDGAGTMTKCFCTQVTSTPTRIDIEPKGGDCS